MYVANNVACCFIIRIDSSRIERIAQRHAHTYCTCSGISAVVPELALSSSTSPSAAGEGAAAVCLSSDTVRILCLQLLVGEVELLCTAATGEHTGGDPGTAGSSHPATPPCGCFKWRAGVWPRCDKQAALVLAEVSAILLLCVTRRLCISSRC